MTHAWKAGVPPIWADSFVQEQMTAIHTDLKAVPAATKLSNYYSDRDKLLDNKMSAEEFEAKWSGVKVAGRELLADTDHIFRMENAGVLRLRDLYASGGYAE